MNLGLTGTPPRVEIDPAHMRSRMLPITVVGDAFERAIETETSIVEAVLQDTHRLAVIAALNGSRRALPAEAVLHDEIDDAAKRVQPKHGVAAPDIHAVDGSRRNRVPIDRVAECLIQPHAVLIYGEALRIALQGRGFEAVISQVLEHLVALRVAQADAGDTCIQRVQ